MKRFIYLCGMMLLSLNMMAQIDLGDNNWDWEHAFEDEFNTIQSWNINNWISLPDKKWKAYPGSKITHGEHQIFQYDHCIFDVTDGYMRLVAECDSIRIKNHNYALPDTMNGQYPNTLGQTDGLLYFSGEIDTRTKFLYGYFEIQCKLPTHKGAFPAFWLYSSNASGSDTYYEEIDIFEYTWSLGDPLAYWLPVVNPNPTYAGDPRLITTGIYHNLHGNGADVHADTYGRNYPRLPNGSQNVSGWHTYSCEWMPDHVYWYLDGQLVNSYSDVSHIPRHPLTLKTDYAINGYYHYNGTIWSGPAEMTIESIKVFQLKWDCDTDEEITCQNELDYFDYAVKKSVSITSSNEETRIDNTDKVTFRVTDSFEITGPFQVDNGGEFTVIIQECPIDI